MADTAVSAGKPFSTRFEWAGYTLGFGLGGFFDGILLHQILQWHHLLSAIAEARQDIHFLILADGLFHLLMYLITGFGLWLLWRSKTEAIAPASDRRLLANALVGFGAWHILDGILSHWVLGIHRIRMDVDDPLFWDLLWLVLFGLVPAVIGWSMRRNRSGGPPAGTSSRLALLLATAVAAPLAAMPPAARDNTVLVLFWPGTAPHHALAAMQAVDGRLVWTDPAGKLWAMQLPENGDASRLYRLGAMMVSNSVLPTSCLDWFRP